MEAKAHYDVATTKKNASNPSLVRKTAFAAGVVCAAVYAYSMAAPAHYDAKRVAVAAAAAAWWTRAAEIAAAAVSASGAPRAAAAITLEAG